MKIGAINNILNTQNFQGRTNKTNQSKNNKKKLAFALGALATAGALCFATKNNKFSKNIDVKTKLKKIKPNIALTKNVAEKTSSSDLEVKDNILKTVKKELSGHVNVKPNTIENDKLFEELPKELDLETFKNIGGKFDKGKALIKNQAYSGILKTKNAKDEQIIIEYLDGALKSSVKEGQEPFKKIYIDINGEKIIEQYKEIFPQNMVTEKITSIKPNFVEIRKKNPISDIVKTISKNQDGSTNITIQKPMLSNDGKWQRVTSDLKTGKYLDIQDIDHRDTKIPTKEKTNIISGIKKLF